MLGADLELGLLGSRGPLSSCRSYWGEGPRWFREFYFLEAMCSMRYITLGAKFVVIPRNELDKVVIENNASAGIKDRRMGVIV